MTRSKIAISLPKHQLARVHREVRAGRADSVSGYIAGVLAEQEKRDSLRTLLRDLIDQHGEPAQEDIKWEERMLPRRGGDNIGRWRFDRLGSWRQATDRFDRAL